MNAQEALKRANARGAELMLHATTLAERRESSGDVFANWHPAAIVAVGLAAGAVFGRVVANHPKMSGIGAFALTLLRAAPAEQLWRLWGAPPGVPPS